MRLLGTGLVVVDSYEIWRVLMSTATELLYRAAGCPEFDGPVGARPVEPCGLCGGMAFMEGRPLRDKGKGKGKIEGWLKPTFTAYPLMAHYHEDGWICSACLFSMREWIVLEGRENQKMRTYSHLCEGDRWTLATKSPDGRRAIRSFILGPHAFEWCATIAVSGQKHLCFLSRTNPPTHRTDQPAYLQVETDCLCVRPVDLERLLLLYEEAYTVFSKTEINGGDYSPRRIGQFGPARLRSIEIFLRQERGSLLFGLAGFLAIREDKEDETDGVEDADTNGRSAGDAQRNISQPATGSDPIPAPATSGSGGKSDHPLGQDAGCHAEPGPTMRQCARVVRSRDAAPPDQQPQQLDLFSR